MHGRRPWPDAHGLRQRFQHEARQRLAQACHQRLGHKVAGPPIIAQRRPAAGLDGAETVLLLSAIVVLRVAGADHDIADAESRIEAARHAAHHQRATAEAIEQ